MSATYFGSQGAKKTIKKAAPGESIDKTNQECTADARKLMAAEEDSLAIRPLYPVRYAYANFIGEELSAAAEPPPLEQLFGNTDPKQGKGYLARILRPGWVYIKEEGCSDGYFHIFKYQHTQNGDQLEERFSKMLFSNGINAQEGLYQDNSGSGGSYPFAFVRKHVTEISIVYSEHEWHPDIIDTMNGKPAERLKAMQRVNLISEDDSTVEATADNLKALVEDYRNRQQRLLQLKDKDFDTSIEKISLDLLTTSSSYDMAPEQLATALRERAKRLEQGKVARIVGLYDPVGRQRDIAEVHAKLALWEKNYTSSNIYPYTIGNIVNSLRDSDDEDLKEIVDESINWQEHDQYWADIKTEILAFQKRQQRFAELYKAFMIDPALTGKVGSLDTYFSHFFHDSPGNNADVDKECGKLAEATAGILTGIISSQPGKATLEEIFSDESKKNGLYASLRSLRTLVTTPQNSFEWSRLTLKSLDWIFRQLGPLFGELSAWVKYGAQLSKRAGNRLTFNGLSYITEKLVPDLLKAFGIEIDPHKTVKLTGDELAKIMADMINKNASRYPAPPSSKPPLSAQWAKAKLKKAQALFDWGNAIKDKKLPELWTLCEVKATKVAGARYNAIDWKNRFQVAGVNVEGVFGGISGFFNVLTMTDLLNQSRFSKENPIRKASRHSTALQCVAALLSLSVDSLAVARAGASTTGIIAGKSSLQVAQALAPLLKKRAEFLAVALKSKIAKGIIAVANLATVVDSIISGTQAWEEGNMQAVAGHAMVGVGSGIFFAQALYVMAGGAASGPLFIAFAIIALLLVIAGVVMLIFSKKSDFQHLLENCFWGKGPKYLFWAFRKVRPVIGDRINIAQRIVVDQQITEAYETELQEFMNYLNMPALEIEHEWGLNTKRYDLTFQLPNFQPGLSEVYGAIYDVHPGYTVLGEAYSESLTKQLQEGLVQAVQTATKTQRQAGNMTLKLSLSGRALTVFRCDIALYWYYSPQPGIVAPLRYIVEGDKRTTPLIGMKNEETIE